MDEKYTYEDEITNVLVSREGVNREVSDKGVKTKKTCRLTVENY